MYCCITISWYNDINTFILHKIIFALIFTACQRNTRKLLKRVGAIYPLRIVQSAWLTHHVGAGISLRTKTRRSDAHSLSRWWRLVKQNMAFDFLGKLKPRSTSVPESIHVPAGMGPVALPKPKHTRQDAEAMTKFLMTLNRAERRNFMRQSGIKIQGSTKPFINSGKKK